MALREGMVEGGHSTQHEPLRAAAQVLAAMIRVRIRVRREILTCPIRGSNSVTVFMASRRYRQINSAQELKET